MITQGSNFYNVAREHDLCVNEMHFIKEIYENDDFENVECKEVIFENTNFYSCSFEKTTFIKTRFVNCDLSNCNFKNGYFKDCEFTSCKCMGFNLNEGMLLNCKLKNCNFKYSIFDKSKIDNVNADCCDFTEASLSEVAFKKFKTNECRFISTNFFKSKLKGLDFSKDELIAPVVSDNFTELKKLKINEAQASELVVLLGVDVV